MARQQQASAADFRSMAVALQAEIMEDVCKEHDREVDALYQEQVDLRTELSRIVEMMTKEILPREKQMHDMIEKMQQAYAAATQQMHAKLTGHMQNGGLGSDQDKQRQQL